MQPGFEMCIRDSACSIVRAETGYDHQHHWGIHRVWPCGRNRVDERMQRATVHWRNLEPVSYTHLDVYKRQGVCLCTKCFGQLDKVGIFIEIRL